MKDGQPTLDFPLVGDGPIVQLATARGFRAFAPLSEAIAALPK
jgi:hypothetical protein